MNRLKLQLLPIVALLCVTLPAHAATVLRVNKDNTKVLLKLTQAEMATLDDGQNVVMEFDKPDFVVSGVLSKFNAVKQTVVMTVDEAEPRFAKKQQAHFLSVYWNAESSPLITSYGQYHQYSRSGVEAGLGGFAEGTNEKSSVEKSTNGGTGYRFRADGYALLSPEWTGAGLGYEHREANWQSKTDSRTDKLGINYDLIRPGAWLDVQPGWRLGFAYNYSMIGYEEKGAGAGKYFLSFGQPGLSAVNYDSDFEWGIDYIGADEASATDSTGSGAKFSMKMPAEIFTYFRSVSSPVFIWGLGGGYIFYERALDGQMRPTATLGQLLRFRATFETRRDNGDKLDWVFHYEGGKAAGLSTLAPEANEGGLSLTYQTMATDRFMWGYSVDVAGGMVTLKDEVEDQTTKQISTVDRQVIGYHFSLLAMARYDFDLLEKKGRR